MPRNPRARRRGSRRRGRARPAPEAPTLAVPSGVTPARPVVQSRPARLVQREAPYLRGELRRVAGVSAVCLTLLAMLVVVDRLS